MADGQLFLRSNGKITGPYDVLALQQLVQRSRLARWDEISTDKENWTPAGEYLELFPTERNPRPTHAARSVAPLGPDAVDGILDKDDAGARKTVTNVLVEDRSPMGESITFRCSQCQKKIGVKSTAAGKRIKCPQCHAIQQVPAAVPAATAPALDEMLSESLADLTPTASAQQSVAASWTARKNRSVLSKLGDFLVAYWYVVAGLVVVVGMAGGSWAVYSAFFRDRWEEQNAPALNDLYDKAAALRTQGQLEQSEAEYGRLYATLQGHAAAKPLQTQALIDLLATTKLELQDVQSRVAEAAARKTANAALVTAQKTTQIWPKIAQDEAAADKIPLRESARQIAAYEGLLRVLADLDGQNPKVAEVSARITQKRAMVLASLEKVASYLKSLDPFIQKVIPFERRLKLGMPEAMFSNRFPTLLTAWRAVQDPPDRSELGNLLSKTNNLAAYIAFLDQRQKETAHQFSRDNFAQTLSALPHKQIQDSQWQQMVDGYLHSMYDNRTGELKNIGRIVTWRAADFDIDQFRAGLQDLEVEYRSQYVSRLGQPYEGKWSLTNPALHRDLRVSFLDSFAPFVELGLPTLRRFESGAERRVLLERLRDLDERFGKIEDPPDDTAIGDFLKSLNGLSEIIWDYSFATPGSTTLDIVGQGDVKIKKLNDTMDAFRNSLDEYRHHKI